MTMLIVIGIMVMIVKGRESEGQQKVSKFWPITTKSANLAGQAVEYDYNYGDNYCVMITGRASEGQQTTKHVL